MIDIDGYPQTLQGKRTHIPSITGSASRKIDSKLPAGMGYVIVGFLGKIGEGTLGKIREPPPLNNPIMLLPKRYSLVFFVQPCEPPRSNNQITTTEIPALDCKKCCYRRTWAVLSLSCWNCNKITWRSPRGTLGRSEGFRIASLIVKGL